jgi:hypothetical protein
MTDLFCHKIMQTMKIEIKICPVVTVKTLFILWHNINDKTVLLIRKMTSLYTFNSNRQKKQIFPKRVL